jgi:hypothetical protein
LNTDRWKAFSDDELCALKWAYYMFGGCYKIQLTNKIAKPEAANKLSAAFHLLSTELITTIKERE